MPEMSTDHPVEIPSFILLRWLSDLDEDYWNGGRRREEQEEDYMADLRRILTQHETVKVVPA